MKPWLKDYFTFSTSEKYGVVGLISLIVILLILPYFIPMFQKTELTDYSEFAKKVEAAQLNKVDSNSVTNKPAVGKYPSTSKKPKSSNRYQPKPAQLFKFNPNTATEKDFIKLGISKKTAANIVKYRSKGGNFRKPDDFSKIYGLSDNQFEQLKPYINIPKKEFAKKSFSKPNKPAPKKKKYKPEPVIVDIATADTTELKRITGIGSVFAKRIVKFRSSLGGFHNLNQVSEVYGIDEEKLTQIQSQITFSNQPLSKLNINIDTSKTLAQHPYINYKVANAIEKYRMQHGNYENISQLKNIIIIDDELFNKIQPYISTQ